MGQRATSVTVAAVATSVPIPVNHLAKRFAVGIGCVRSADATYTVEHTFDNIFDPTVTPTWFPHASLVAKVVSADGNYSFPVRAIRLNVTVWTTGPGVTMTIIQND